MKPIILSTLSITGAAALLAGCGTGLNINSNASSMNKTTANQSSNVPSLTGSQVTGHQTTMKPLLPVQPSTLNVTRESNLSLHLSGSASSLDTFNATCTPDFLNSNQGFAVVPRGLMYTANGGTTWEHILTPSGEIMDVHFTSAATGWIITSVGDTPSNTKQTFRIYRTTDSGRHWQQQWSGVVQSGVGNTHMFSFGGQSAYAVVANRLLTLDQNGGSWTAVSLPVGGSVAEADFANKQQLGWVVIQQTEKPKSSGGASMTRLVVLQTSNGGRNWHVQLQTASFSGNDALLQFGSTKNGLLFYKDLERMQTVIYRTTDGGQSWSKSTPQALEGRIFAGRPVFQSDGSVWVPMSAGAAPFASSVIASSDMGKTWHTVTQAGEWRNFTISHRFGNTAYVVAGLNQGYALLKTADGGRTWSQLLPNLQPTRAVSFVSSSVGYALGTNANENAILKTTDGGRTWEMAGSLPEETQVNGMVFSSEERGYVMVAPMTSGREGNTMVMETKDGGKTWSPASFGEAPENILQNISQHGDIVDPVYFLPPGSSSDSGNWVLASTGYPKLYTFVAGNNGTKVEASYNDPPGAIEGYSFLGPTDGWMSVLRTKKSGSMNGQTTIDELDNANGTWVTKWTLPTGWSVEGMDRLSEQNAWLVAQKPWTSLHPTLAVFRTNDGGETWMRYQLPDAPFIEAPATTANSTYPIDFVNKNDGWLLTQQGLLKTTDGGATWIPAS